MANEPLITKYRPRTFEEVLGHDEQVEALKRRLDADNRPHAFLLTGPSGVGKTTLARIIGNYLEAEVLEIDAGSSGSIETIRELIDHGQHLALSGARFKMFIIDECHSVSNAGKQALLKFIEEPPEHLFLALCTTEAHRVPDTWKTRCYQVPLRAVKPAVIEDLLGVVSELEGWKPDPDVFQAIVQGATGQPRKAISLLESLHDAPSKEEAKRVMALLEDSDPVLELGRLLVNGAAWTGIRPVLQQIEDTEFDGALIPLTRFVISAWMRETNLQAANRLAQVVQALTFPTNTFDPKAAFMAAICRVLWPA